MMDAPHRISIIRDILGWGLSFSYERDGTETSYILETREALLASPVVQDLLREAKAEGMEGAMEICNKAGDRYARQAKNEGMSQRDIDNQDLMQGAVRLCAAAIHTAVAAVRKGEPE